MFKLKLFYVEMLVVITILFMGNINAYAESQVEKDFLQHCTQIENKSGVSIDGGTYEGIIEHILSHPLWRNWDIEKRAPEVCNGKPYHEMRSRGFGRVTLSDGSTYIRLGACFQCPHCKLVMVTEGDPLKGQSIGKYAISYPGYTINSGGADINIPAYYGVHNGTTMEGYKFLYQ